MHIHGCCDVTYSWMSSQHKQEVSEAISSCLNTALQIPAQVHAEHRKLVSAGQGGRGGCTHGFSRVDGAQGGDRLDAPSFWGEVDCSGARQWHKVLRKLAAAWAYPMRSLNWLVVLLGSQTAPALCWCGSICLASINHLPRMMHSWLPVTPPSPASRHVDSHALRNRCGRIVHETPSHAQPAPVQSTTQQDTPPHR